MLACHFICSWFTDLHRNFWTFILGKWKFGVTESWWLESWYHHNSMLQAVDGLYCVGDSCFPGQGVIAVAFSGTMCAHRVAADLGDPLFLMTINVFWKQLYLNQLAWILQIEESCLSIANCNCMCWSICAGLERRSIILDQGLGKLLAWFRTLA
jgi:hypothetical protein